MLLSIILEPAQPFGKHGWEGTKGIGRKQLFFRCLVCASHWARCWVYKGEYKLVPSSQSDERNRQVNKTGTNSHNGMSAKMWEQRGAHDTPTGVMNSFSQNILYDLGLGGVSRPAKQGRGIPGRGRASAKAQCPESA